MAKRRRELLSHPKSIFVRVASNTSLYSTSRVSPPGPLSLSPSLSLTLCLSVSQATREAERLTALLDRAASFTSQQKDAHDQTVLRLEVRTTTPVDARCVRRDGCNNKGQKS